MEKNKLDLVDIFFMFSAFLLFLYFFTAIFQAGVYWEKEYCKINGCEKCQKQKISKEN